MRVPRFVVPFCIAAGVFGALLALMVRHGLRVDGGTFVYPLDDAYIHLAVSRNLALHGVWGISRFGFSGASSSPGWTLLLAALIRAGGVHAMTPLVLNGIAGLGVLLLASVILASALKHAGWIYRTASLCAMVLVVPMPGLASIGMEHMLHSLAMLGLIATAAWVMYLHNGAVVPLRAIAALLGTAAIAGSLRYESCFAIVVVMIGLAQRRRLGLAALVGAAAAIGPVSYGIYSRAHSPVMLPFSVVMKSSGGGVQLRTLLTSNIAPILVILAVIFFLRKARRERGDHSYAGVFLGLVLATTFLHALVGPVGWLMRYEAYLYVLGLMAVALAVGEGKELARQRGAEGRVTLADGDAWVALAMSVALLTPLAGVVHRAHHGWSDVLESTHDRYVEHLPQALFVGREMPHAVVIANDIGFLSFYAGDARILDPLGLGSVEPVMLERAHRTVDPEFVEAWGAKEKADLAILHTDFPGMDQMIPTGWVLVESWCFPNNLVFLNHVQSFYAPDATSAATLRQKMATFQALPSEVVRYRFPEDGSLPPDPVRGETAVCPAVSGSASTVASLDR